MSTSYLWCWNEFAQIIYEGTDNSLTYRKTSGTDDISGDYNQYEQILDKVVNGVDITIKAIMINIILQPGQHKTFHTPFLLMKALIWKQY